MCAGFKNENYHPVIPRITKTTKGCLLLHECELARSDFCVPVLGNITSEGVVSEPDSITRDVFLSQTVTKRNFVFLSHQLIRFQFMFLNWQIQFMFPELFQSQ